MIFSQWIHRENGQASFEESDNVFFPLAGF